MYRAMADYGVLEGDACIHYFKCHFDFLCHKLQQQILERAIPLHYVNVSVLIKLSLKTTGFIIIIF